MVKAIDPNQRLSYVPTCDRDLPTEEQTTFFFTIPKRRHRIALMDGAASATDRGRTIRSQVHGLFDELVRINLVGWSGFTNGDGLPVEFRSKRQKLLGEDVTGADPDLLDLLPSEVMGELRWFMQQHTELSGNEGNG